MILEAVRRWLEHNRAWLLVFDNVPAPKEVLEYLPQGATGQVIITSRDPNWGSVATPLSVQPWEREASIEFLSRRTGQEDEDAAGTLAEAVGDLPLALEQAASYVGETGRSVAYYVELFRDRQAQLVARGEPPTGYEYTVATTWDLSFEQAKEECAAAADLLNLCAFLGPDDIPLDIIRAGSKHLPERLAGAARDDLAWDEAIAALRRYSLVEVSDDALSLHRLVQAVTRDRLSAEDRREWAGAAVAVLNGAFPADIQTGVDTWPLCSRLLPHALASAADAQKLDAAAEPTLGLLNQVGVYLRGRAQFADAKAAFERALQIAEVLYDGDRPEVARQVNNLGQALRDLGELAEARTHGERALRIAEAAYGPDHPAVAKDVNNLGSVLRDEGDLAQAGTHFERALRIDEAAYGPEHHQVAVRVNNLGGVLRRLGDLTGARAHFERALRIDEMTYGLDHPEVARDANNLGGVLQDLGDLAEARSHYERALGIFRGFLGDDHPHTVTARKNLEALGK